MAFAVTSVWAAPALYLADSPAAQDLVAEADDLQEQGRLADAVDRLQQVIQEYPDRLMEVESGRHEDATRWVRRRLREDEQLRRAYQRTYGARAERELEVATTPELDPQALERVVAEYATTEAGLEAGLTLAGVYLERAAAHSAASVLDELAAHPQLDQHRTRYHTLQAMVGLFTGDPARRAEHEQHLREHGASEPLNLIAAIAGRLTGPVRRAAAPPCVMEEPLSSDALAEPLWESDAGWTPMGSVTAELADSRFVRQRESGEPPVPTLPIADDRRVYLNQGDRVRALDRDSGWQLWSYHWPGIETLDELPATVRMRGHDALHERGTLHHESRLYAVFGSATPWPVRWNQASSATAVVSLDPTSGASSWEVTPGDLDPALSEAYFLGTPRGGDGRIFVLLRRTQASGFRDTYLAALASDDGRLLWRRHIAAAAMASRFNTGPSPRMSTADGRVYVVDNLGAVAAMDQRTGAIQWLRLLGDAERVNDEDMARAALRQRAAEADGGTAPVRCAAGLIVREPVEGAVQLLDPRTGALLRSLSGEPWQAARALRRIDGQVLVIGDGLTLVDGETLETQWHHPLKEAGALPSPVGQIAATRDQLFYTAADHLGILRRDNGELLQRRAIDTPANLLPLESQLVVVGRDAVRSYTSWPRAAVRLRQRMKNASNDPAPALALAQLAARRRDGAVVIEGVDQALAALRRAQHEAAASGEPVSDVQARTFTQVLQLARHETIAALDDQPQSQRSNMRATGLREMLFDSVAAITAGPAQEVAYHMARVEFLVDVDRVPEAVEHLQVVLADEVLASQLYEAAPVSRQAGLEAQQRLRALIDEYGREIYAAYDRQALRQLRRLVAQRGDAEALIALADRHPLAAAAPRALVHAARRMAEADRFAAAIEQLRRARDRAHSDELIAQVVGQAVVLYEAHGEPGHGIAWLRHLQREHPDVTPTRDGIPVGVEDWIARLERMAPGSSSLPSLALPMDAPHLVPGRLVPVAHESWAMTQRDVLLTQDNQTLRLYARDNLDVRWERALSIDQPRVISADAERLLLWSPRDHQLVALDEATGESMWQRDAAALLRAVGDADDRAAAHVPDRRRFDPLLQQHRLVRGDGALEEVRNDSQRFALVGAGSVAMVDRMGRVVGIDRQGGQVRWQLMSAIEQVTHAQVRHDTLLLGGVLGPGTDAETGAIVAIDLRSGEQIMPVIEDRRLPQWLGFAGDRTMVVASEGRLTAYRLGSGAVAWRAEVDETDFGDLGWANDRLVMVRDQADVAHLFDAQTGEHLRRVHLAETLGARAVRASPTEQRWYVHTQEGLACFDAGGRMRWRDAIAESSHQALGQWVTRDHIVLLARRRADVGGEQAQAPAWVVQPGDGAVPPRVDPDHAEQVEPAEAAEADDDGAEDEADQFGHHLYVLDRRTGAIVAEHPVGPLPAGVRAAEGAVQRNRLVMPAGDRTLILSGRAD